MELAERHVQVYGLKGRFIHCNAENLASQVGEPGFDLVYSFGAIHHTPSPDAVIREVRKVIAPDGEFRLMLYAKNSWKDAMIEAGLDQPEAQSGCPIAFTYTPGEVIQLIEPAGFKVTNIQQDHIFPYVIEDYVRYKYTLQPWFAAMPEAMFRALKRRFGWRLLITAVAA